MKFKKPLVNKKFNSLLVLSDYVNEKDKHHKHYCHCMCDCGLTLDVRDNSLTSGNTKTCGRCASVRALGRKFGRLTVVSTFYKNKRLMCNCLCDCHKNNEYTVVTYHNLLTGNTKSCGCYEKEHPNNIAHNMSKTSLYGVWSGLKSRCCYKGDLSYSLYGGRGIEVCDRWLDSFENFCDDMNESYQQHIKQYGIKDTSIDRIDVNGNYCKENCQWATAKEQANNRRTTIKITHNGETHSLKEWCEIFGTNYYNACYRYKHNWEFSKIFSKEIFSTNAQPCKT